MFCSIYISEAEAEAVIPRVQLSPNSKSEARATTTKRMLGYISYESPLMHIKSRARDATAPAIEATAFVSGIAP